MSSHPPSHSHKSPLSCMHMPQSPVSRSSLTMMHRSTFIALSTLSFCLSTAIVGSAGHTLHIYRAQAFINAWWLPVWPQHFNTHGLEALIGTSVIVIVLDIVVVALVLVHTVSLMPSLAHGNRERSCASVPRLTRGVAMVKICHLCDHLPIFHGCTLRHHLPRHY